MVFGNYKTDMDLPSEKYKISVIVPVYNVEPFLPRCLNSLRNQSLEDIEILLVDDGSTDASGVICDEYALKDPRIRVIHKPNEGLSAARNEGISKSVSPYIMFVDSDDWVEPGFCEKPYVTAIRSEADVVIFDSCIEKNGKIQKREKNKPTGIVDAETALRFGGNVAWNKLYQREVFNNICYPKGKAYEDVAVTYKILFSAKRIVMIPDTLYYWVYRKGSITNCRSSRYKRDAFMISLQRAKDLKSYGCSEELFMIPLWTYAIRYVARSKQCDDSYYIKAEAVIDDIKGVPSVLPNKLKAILIVWKFNKSLFHLICKVTGQKYEEVDASTIGSISQGVYSRKDQNPQKGNETQ